MVAEAMNGSARAARNESKNETRSVFTLARYTAAWATSDSRIEVAHDQD